VQALDACLVTKEHDVLLEMAAQHRAKVAAEAAAKEAAALQVVIAAVQPAPNPTDSWSGDGS
jgi:hypothetical protein